MSTHDVWHIEFFFSAGFGYALPLPQFQKALYFKKLLVLAEDRARDLNLFEWPCIV